MKDYLTLIHTKWDCKYHVVLFRSAARRCSMEA